jgi:CTP:molybdopterin cytidylyltransferase MocA
VIAGIILAAGASRRMGSPKALLDYRGETFIGRMTRVYAEFCAPVIVVLGYHAAVVGPAVANGATVVTNPDPERGQLSSLQTALAALPADAEGFLFAPVDSPAIESATVGLLAAEFRRRDPATVFVIPRYQGKRGHPVFATRAVADEILALPATAQARDVVHRHIDHTQYIDVTDPGILTDVDDPAAYRQMLETAR